MSNWKDVRRQIDIVCQIVVSVNTFKCWGTCEIKKRAMLKSRFNLAQPGEEASEHAVSEEMEQMVVEEEEKKIVYPVKVLNRAQVGLRLSLLGKTAEGDG